mmetsp:Transcript_2240/g.7982  ORF Transcript_2240/g.7982 Transcript_2240/m.7982 type:complete len:256 (-) Transcript_2240:280-1047(-)
MYTNGPVVRPSLLTAAKRLWSNLWRLPTTMAYMCTASTSTALTAACFPSLVCCWARVTLKNSARASSSCSTVSISSNLKNLSFCRFLLYMFFTLNGDQPTIAPSAPATWKLSRSSSCPQRRTTLSTFRSASSSPHSALVACAMVASVLSSTEVKKRGTTGGVWQKPRRRSRTKDVISVTYVSMWPVSSVHGFQYPCVLVSAKVTRMPPLDMGLSAASLPSATSSSRVMTPSTMSMRLGGLKASLCIQKSRHFGSV